MTHPEVLLIPVLMFSDYFLTVWGSIQSEKGYRNHFKAEHYELNPIWRKTVAAHKWFNPRHIVLTLLLSGGFIYILESGTQTVGFSRFLLGVILVLYGMVLGRHLSNLLIFRYVSRTPSALTGEIKMSMQFIQWLSLFQTLGVFIPVTLIAFISSSYFAVGGSVGLLLFIFIQMVWMIRVGKKR